MSTLKTAYYAALARKASNLAAAGGLIQIALALVLGFFPVFKTCIYLLPDPPILVSCSNLTYIDEVGAVPGVLLLGSMILSGALALLSARSRVPSTVLWLRWFGVLIYVSAFIFADAEFRLLFLPGALCILLSIGLNRKKRNPAGPGF